MRRSRITEKEVSQGPTYGTSTLGKVDLVYNTFYKLSENHGYDVVLEKAIKCPCAVAGARATSSCKNCGGTGWIFVNPEKVLVVMQSTRIHSPESTYTESDLLYASGKIKITALPDLYLSYMDKLTVTNAVVEFTESLPLVFDSVAKKFVARLIYPPTKINYIGAYKSENEKLIRIDSGYEVVGDFVYLEPSLFESIQKDEVIGASLLDTIGNKSSMGITLRYQHNPIYHILENIRDFMTVKVKGDDGLLKSVPSLTLSIGQKRALMINKTNYSPEPILDNSWPQQ